MAIYRNLCSWQPLPTFEDGDIVDGGNFSQAKPHTLVMADVTAKITIRNSNCLRCDFPSNITVDESTCLVGHPPEYIEDVEPQRNPELSAFAVAARSMLMRSEKLTPEISAQLDQLEAGVKQVAGVDLHLGESATLLVQKMIDAPEIQAQPALKEALESALAGIVAMTGGQL